MLKIRRIKELSREERDRILRRSRVDIESVLSDVRAIVAQVRERKDNALLQMLKQTNPKAGAEDIRVQEEEFREAEGLVSKELKEALREAAQNIETFHRAQLEKPFWSVEIREGILLGRVTRPIEKVGCYIPGGRAPYPSTVLMTVIPAKVAGVREIYITTPCGEDMKVNPAILYAARMAGATSVFKIGGPWGIAAFAFGTETIPKVDKIVGPGNKYVTAAKLLVFGEVDIDSPAGPSEGLILADSSANPQYLAWDLISQMEHDPEAAGILITTDETLAKEVQGLLMGLLPEIPKRDIILGAMGSYSLILIAEDIEEALDFVNGYAPEHLEIHSPNPFELLLRIQNAGSVFLGEYAPIPVGDYASGTNHVLPTGGAARAFSGLSVDSFLKRITFQYLSRGGLRSIAHGVSEMSKAEGLLCHSEAVMVRLKDEG